MAERVIRNVENDYLMCAICLGRYTDPRLLPCGHTFCKKCLEDHIKQTVTDRAAMFFKCPNDRTQIQRPSLSLPPKDWANAFPVDTFLASLLNAVMTHGSQTSDESMLKCELHKGRTKEFYCLRCSVTVCAYCVVKQHKGNNCECVSIEEAVEKFQPKIDLLRNKLKCQMKTTKKIIDGDSPENNIMKDSKEKAMTELTDLETKMTFFYQTALRQLAEMKTTILDTGTRQLTENQQASVVLGKINDTAEKLKEICSNGNGFEILNTMSHIESRVHDYDVALQSLGNQPSSMEVHFVVNRELERLFENMPALGSVVVQSRSKGNRARVKSSFNPVMSENPPLLTTPRNMPLSARTYAGMTPRESMASSLNWSQDFNTPNVTPRSTVGTTTSTERPGRRRSLPTRAKVTFSVQTPEILTSCWQLTGIITIQNYMILTDAHNGMVLKCEFSSATPFYGAIALECPVCVAGIPGSSIAVVTLPEKSELALIETEFDLTFKETIVTNKPYEGIACLPDEKCVVSCCVIGKQCVDVINMGGEIIKSISNDSSGEQLFSWPRFIDVTQSGNILVSDRDNRTLKCIDQSGTLKWTYPTPASPWGVSSHENGSVFLCLDNNVIQVLSDSGRLLQNKFISSRDGVRIPYAICARTDQVVVTEWGPSLFSPNSPLVNIFSI